MSAPMIFLKIYVKGKPIKGSAVVQDHIDEIEVEDFSWSSAVKLPGKGSGANARAVVETKPLEFAKFVDRASPGLYNALKDRKTRFTTATFTVVAPMVVQNTRTFPKLMTMQLSDGFIEKVSVQASGGGKAMAAKESVTLSYRKCKLMYYPTNRSSGGREAPTTFESETPSSKS